MAQTRRRVRRERVQVNRVLRHMRRVDKPAPGRFTPTFDRMLRPIGMRTYRTLQLVFPRYLFVARDTCPARHAWVSTVWLGADHNFSGCRPGPVVFETMIFGGAPGEQGRALGQWRWDNEQDARDGHWLIAWCLNAGMPLPWEETNDDV